LQREREHAQQQIGFDERERSELARRDEDLAAEQGRSQEQGGALGVELANARSERDAAGAVLAAAAARLDQNRRLHASAQAQVATLERELEAARQASLAAMARAAARGQQQGEDETLGRELGRQLERWEQESAGALAEIESGGARRGQLQLEFQGQEAALQQLGELAARLQQRVSELAAAQAEAQAAAQQARTQAAEAGARRASLQEIVAQHGYSSEAVRALLGGRAGEGFRALGVLGEYLEVEAPLDRVVEQFLQDELNFVVVENWQQAGAGLELLRRQEQGRATLLVHGEAGSGESAGAGEVEASWRSTAAGESGVTPALAKVRALNGFRQGLEALLPKLRDAFLLDDAGEAQRLAERYPQGYFLTPQGECYHGCLVSGGSGASRGPLSLKRELREWSEREGQQQAALAHQEQRQQALTREGEAAQRELEQARQQQHESEKRQWASSQAVEQAAAELARGQARLQQAQLEAERTRAAHRAALE
ncbi:MAG: hypothetical protein ACRD1E_10370, partial [Terriglobales bacterium]